MNIIVNGGSRGIGRELAVHFAGDPDNQLLVTGRDEKALKELAGSCIHENVSYLAFDLSLLDFQIVSFKDQIYSRFSKVDILINNAGSLTVKEFMKMSNKEARTMMETNFFGPASLIRLIKPIMASGSHIVNISSMGGFQGSSKYRGLSYYSASKAALATLTECLAEEFSEDGISVNCLALGSVQTEMFETAFPGYKAPVSAKEMGEFVAYFALNGNRFFNGKIIPVALGNP
ncbi:MAG TPA: SDR family oxidoreductase [Bacteroidales bacterium]|nr:SDR family oxidoreductase [Bacteroidales bacterium]